MNSQPRLYARAREIQQNPQYISSENIVIGLFDSNFDDRVLRQKLDYLINCPYFRVTDVDKCLEIINQDDKKDTLMMLITSNPFINIIEKPELCLSHIYLHDTTLSNPELTNQRIRGVFHDIHTLVQQIFFDIENVRRRKIFGESMQFVLEDDARFYWYRFFFHILEYLQHTKIARSEFISQLSIHQEKKFLQYMEDYGDDETLYKAMIVYYTGDNGCYFQLNNNLRSEDINKIFPWRFYIQCLDRSLREVCIKQRYTECVHLYRGQHLHKEEIKKMRESIDQLLSVNSFFSTTRCWEVAEMFVPPAQLTDSPLVPVLYTISVNFNQVKSICADVSKISHYSDEAEFLFSIRSLFRIQRVEFIDNFWQIDLITIDENDYQFIETMNPWQATIGEQSFFSGRHEPIFTRHLNPEDNSFLAFQLLIDFILRLDRTEFSRLEMLEKCRTKCEGDPIYCKQIDEFEQTYRQEDAARWYTQNSFVYRLLNEALRIEDIDTLVKLRYYIYDLHNQLALLQLSYVQSLPANETTVTLYRGQRMKSIDLEKLRENIGNLVSMNSFLSTTSNVLAAVFFSGDSTLDDPTTETSVLYQITIDTTIPHSIPFAKIQSKSIFEHEDEVLFSMASVFRIDNVEKYGQLEVVDLTLINKEDETWNKLTAHLTK